jgi:hypothetical protein
MQSVMLLLLFLGYCSLSLVSADPLPTGGLNCTRNFDCHTPNGNCTDGVCVCSDRWGNPDCSYGRQDRMLAGGLQFLCFAGIGGVGNFMLGRTGPAIGQLVLVLTYLIGCCLICCALCAVFGGTAGKIFGSMGGIIVITIIVACVLTGFIWSIIDGAGILGNRIVDGNGYGTYSSL